MNRVVVITGASEGIGAALARHLGARGDSLVLAARRQHLLEEVAAGIGRPVLVVPADVTVRADVERVRDRALSHFGSVDVWVNNAGRGLTRSVLELTGDEIDQMVAFNVKSAVYGMQAIVPHFIERGRGHVINMSSYLSRVPAAPFRSAYSGAKAMLNSLSDCLRAEVAAFPDIHVTLVFPGPVATSFRDNALGGTPSDVRAVLKNMPRQESAEEVAAVIAGAIDRPRPEVYTNEDLHLLAVNYVRDPYLPGSKDVAR